jgi:hypothetical protein
MNKNMRKNTQAALLLIAGLLGAGVAFAAQNEQGRGRDENRRSRIENAAAEQNGRFEERQRAVAVEYFSRQAAAGRCPPGLARKGNGCNPPGQVRQWQIGRPLPADVTWYELERDLLDQLGQAPAGYRYAGLDNDILLLELGTMVVVDAIHALSD